MANIIYMKKSEYDKITAEKLRTQYLQSPPSGLSREEILTMSVNDILDMDYFLHEDSFFDEFDDGFDSAGESDTIIYLIDDDPNELDDPDIPL